jgi:hypothetical protein
VFAVSFTYTSLFRLPGPVLLFMKLQTYRIDTMPLIRRRRISLTLKDMAQMSTTITADNLCPLHAECAICMSGDGTGDAVEVRRPPTARLEFMVGLIQWCIAAGACVHAGRGLVLVVLACKWGLGTFFSEDAELFYRGEETQLVKQRAFKYISRWERWYVPFLRTTRTWIQNGAPLVFGPFVGIRHFL